MVLCHSGDWTISGSHLDLHDPRLLAMAAAERRLLEAQYAEYADANASGAAFYRAAVLIVSFIVFLPFFCPFMNCFSLVGIIA